MSLPEITASKRYAEFDFLTTEKQINLDRLSSELKMEPSILKKLNSALLKNCTPPDQKYQLRLPAGMKESAKIALNEIFAENNENNYPARHIVKKGETLWSISKKYGTSVLTLQKINGLKDGDILSEGKILYIR